MPCIRKKVQGGRIRLRVRQTDQPEASPKNPLLESCCTYSQVEIVEDHVGVFQMRPSSERTAKQEIARLRVFLMSQAGVLHEFSKEIAKTPSQCTGGTSAHLCADQRVHLKEGRGQAAKT